MLTGVGSAVTAGAASIAAAGVGGYTIGGVVGSAMSNPIIAGYLASTGVGLAYAKSRRGILSALKHPNKKIQQIGKMGASIYRKASHPLVRGLLTYAGASKIASIGAGVQRVGQGKKWTPSSLKVKIQKGIRKERAVRKSQKAFKNAGRAFDI